MFGSRECEPRLSAGVWKQTVDFSLSILDTRVSVMTGALPLRPCALTKCWETSRTEPSPRVVLRGRECSPKAPPGAGVERPMLSEACPRCCCCSMYNNASSSLSKADMRCLGFNKNDERVGVADVGVGGRVVELE